MSPEEKSHMSPEELVSSVVDSEGLSPEASRHLQACPVCSRQRQRIVEDLRTLGWSARRFAPEPFRKIVLPSREPERRPSKAFGWTLGASFAAVAAAVFILILSPGHLSLPGGGQLQEMTAGDMTDDVKLMEDVSMLEENSLPEGYREISPESRTAAVDEDATLDFVVPIDDDGGLI